MGYTVEYQILLLVLERLRLPGISAPQLDLLMMSLSASKISLVQVIALTVSVKSLDFAKRKRKPLLLMRVNVVVTLILPCMCVAQLELKKKFLHVSKMFWMALLAVIVSAIIPTFVNLANCPCLNIY